MFGFEWNNPLTNPEYCGYCKCEPCICDGHGNYEDEDEELDEELEGDEEE